MEMKILQEKMSHMINNKTVLVLLAVLLMCGCKKEVLRTEGVVAADKYVPAHGGSFAVSVTTTGVWAVESLSDWLSVDGKLHKGKGTFTVEYASNESVPGSRRFNRIGRVVVRTWDGATADTVRIFQYGLVPYMSLRDTTVSPDAGEHAVAFTTNLTDAQRKSVSCSSTASWISGAEWASCGDSLNFVTVGSPSSPREGTITVTFTDAWGVAFSESCTIRQ